MSERAIVCYILLRNITEGFSKGCLVNQKDKSNQVYIPHHAGAARSVSSSSCTCSEGDVAPLFADEYQFLCRISDPGDRYDVFKSPYKLKWAKSLRCGDRAYVKLRNNKEGKFVAVEIRWVGQTKIGIKFGVEITDPDFRGKGDASVSNYFKCEERCGMLVDLDALECDKLLHPTINWSVGGTTSAARPRSKAVKSPIPTKDQNVTDVAKEEKKTAQKVAAPQNADLDEDAKAQIASLQAQLDRQLDFHQSELERVEEHWEEQVQLLKESEARLQNELMKKAQNHAEELKEAFESHQQMIEQLEKKQQDLIQKLNKHFQDEVETAYLKLEESLARTYEIDPDEIKISDTVIGKSRLGTVLKGTFRGISVAVKKLHPALVTVDNEKLIEWEFGLLAQIHHPNMVLFLGAAVSIKNELCLVVTELLDMSLYSAYQQHKIKFSALSKLAILFDVSLALVHLHANRVPIIHNRLNSSRVLLESIGGTRQWKAKISLFGISSIVPYLASSSDRANLYASPEVVAANRRDQTEKIDVYSFGVLMCEVALCRSPPPERGDIPIMLSDVHAKDENLFQLATNCTMLSHQNRPSMEEVADSLRALIDRANMSSVTSISDSDASQ